MKCPICNETLRTIPPCSGEYICINEDCPISEREIYGGTQKELTNFVKRIYPQPYNNRFDYRGEAFA